MDYRRFEDTLVLRIDRGEEIVEQLREAAAREKILLAEISALGAVGDFTVGVFHTGEKCYHSTSFQGDFEIVSLTGTITEKDGQIYTHLHMSASDMQGHVFGGHLNRAVVSVTCEMVVRIINGHVGRRHLPDVGLNFFQFDGE